MFILNAKINTICYFASLVVTFFTRKIFLDHLGAEFMGLTGTMSGLLGFLNLAELGISLAIGYVLYKPIFDGDRQKINEIISVLGYVYRIVGFIILFAGIVLSLFMPLIFSDTSFSWGIIYFGFYAYLTASLLGYFVNYKMNLLAADQKNYVITGYFQLTLNVKIILQAMLAYVTNSFFFYLFLEIIIGIVNSIIINKKVQQAYPWLESNIKDGNSLLNKYPEIFRYTGQLFVHKIGTFAQMQLTPLLIYSYVSLPVVALYVNYTMVTSKMSGLFAGMMDKSLSAGVGNLISEGDQCKIYKTYKQLFSFRIFCTGITSACLYWLINPFIEIWLGAEYVMPAIVVLMIITLFFLNLLRGSTDQFLNGYGLFYDIWAPLTEALILGIVAVIGGIRWGLSGVLLGPICSSLIIVHIWRPIFLFTHGFHKPISQYCVFLVFNLFLVTLSLVISYFFIEKILLDAYATMEWSTMIKKAVFLVICTICCFSVVFYIFSADFRIMLKKLILLCCNTYNSADPI